jgi:hypothetical protein
LVGISWANLKERFVRLIPAPVVERLQTTFTLVKTLVVEGPMAAWEQIKEMGEELKASFVAALIDWLKWKVVEEAVKTIMALFIPGAGLVRAIVAIYDTIVFFIQKARDIMEMIGSFLGSIAEIAAGNIGAAADALERGLARGLKLVISFLAKFLRLDGIAARIRGVLDSVRNKVNAVLDKVATWVVGLAKKAGKLGKDGEEKTQPEASKKHHDLLTKMVPALEEDEPGPPVTDAAWLAGKQKKAQQLEQVTQPKLEAGVRISVVVKAGSLPRQFDYDLKIAPNTSAVAGASTPPVLTVGELYVFEVNLGGRKDATTAKFVEVTKLDGRWVIKATPPGERETERSDTGGELRGKWKGVRFFPAEQPDGSPNYRLANAAAPEPPVFKLTNSRRTVRGGLQPVDVQAEPLALTAKYAAPYEDPPGLERIAAALKSSGAWVPGHLVNGMMGGPGSNENLIPIDRGTNATMRGNYENALRQDLRLGKYFDFRAHVEYHSGLQKGIPRTEDFARSVSIEYEEITRSGGAWTKTGAKGSAGPYPVALPTVAELDPTK